MNKSTLKEPLFHVVKRDEMKKQQEWLVRGIAIVFALILCAVITTVFTGDNPLAVYKSIFLGAFGSSRKTWITLQNI